MRAGFPEQSPGAAGLHAEWYAANVEQGTLTAQRCECGVYRLPARYRCAACASDRWAFVPVGPDAVVETFTVTRRPIHFAFAEVVPYASVVARTPEGVRLLLQHRGDAEAVADGDTVRVEVDAYGVPYALPAGDGGPD